MSAHSMTSAVGEADHRNGVECGEKTSEPAAAVRDPEKAGGADCCLCGVERANRFSELQPRGAQEPGVEHGVTSCRSSTTPCKAVVPGAGPTGREPASSRGQDIRCAED